MVVSNKETIKRLLAVKKVLNKYGWCRGHYTDKNGRHCLIGAIWAVDASESAYQIRRELEREAGMRVMSWNDQPDRKKSQVIALIDKTIKRLKNATK